MTAGYTKMQNRRLAMVCRSCFIDTVGGVENHVRFIAKEFQQLGWDVRLFYPKQGPVRGRRELVADGLTIVEISYRLPLTLRMLALALRVLGQDMSAATVARVGGNAATRMISAELTAFDATVVHLHDFVSSVLLARNLARRVTLGLTNHTGEYLLLRRYRAGRAFLRWYLAHFRFVVGPSSELTPVEYHSNATFIPNGADLDLFSPRTDAQRAEVRKSFGIGMDEFVVCCPRRWAPTKGVVYFARAIRDQPFERRLVFVFAGSDNADYPAYANEVAQALSDKLATGQVKVLGNLAPPRLSELLACSDVVVIPSILEAISLVAIEAMASGAIVVATRVGGMPELIQQEQNGLLVPARDSRALAAAVQRLHDDEALRRRLREQGLQTARQYGWNSIARRTLELLENAPRLDSNEDTRQPGRWARLLAQMLSASPKSKG